MKKATKAARSSSGSPSGKNAVLPPLPVYWKRAHRDWKFWAATLSVASTLLLVRCLKHAWCRAASDRDDSQ